MNKAIVTIFKLLFHVLLLGFLGSWAVHNSQIHNYFMLGVDIMGITFAIWNLAVLFKEIYIDEDFS